MGRVVVESVNNTTNTSQVPQGLIEEEIEVEGLILGNCDDHHAPQPIVTRCSFVVLPLSSAKLCDSMP